MEIKALIFDVFGTLVDWRTGVANEAKLFFDRKTITIDPFEFADAWRAEYQPAMERIRSGNRGYVPLEILHRENLDRVLQNYEIAADFSESERAELNHAWEKLPPWPDTAAGLKALKKDYIVAPCSNGSIAMMVRLARFADLRWDAIVGADIATAYKPQAKAYLRSAKALGVPPKQVMMVAAHNFDLEVARRCGLATAFIPRPREHGPQGIAETHATRDWDYIAKDMRDLAAMLTA